MFYLDLTWVDGSEFRKIEVCYNVNFNRRAQPYCKYDNIKKDTLSPLS